MRILYKKGTQIIGMIGRDGLDVDMQTFEDDEVDAAIAGDWSYTPWEACGQDSDGNELEVKKQRGRPKLEA
jgi:hypothetical protein